MVTFRAKTFWIDRPLRVCRSQHHCSVCDKTITLGQRYYDGGARKRAHETCVDAAAERATRKADQAYLTEIMKALRPPRGHEHH